MHYNNGDKVAKVDLSKYEIRTDLVTDIIDNFDNKTKFNTNNYKKNNIKVENINITSKESKIINKKQGSYSTIYFDDITDHKEFSNVLKILIIEIKKMLAIEKIKEHDTVLFLGLGNESITPDSLGPKVIKEVIITKHIYDLTNNLEKGFRITSGIAPGVMGTTGIETSIIIDGIIKKTKPNFIIVIDALASSSVKRVGKTIQITNAGINPGSGVGNKRKEVSKEVFGIPVIAIGVPMVVDAITIVNDTINFMSKYFANNLKNNKEKLTDKEMAYFLGAFGNLGEEEKKSLLFDVLTPIGYNQMVTPKEIDFLAEKLSNLIAKGINKAIHKKYNI